MNNDKIKNLRNTIQSFSKEKQLDVFKLCKSKNIFYSENKNGIFINLTELDAKQLIELDKFVTYINAQEKEIQQMEHEKEKMSQLLGAE
jgi:hypothetical protein